MITLKIHYFFQTITLVGIIQTVDSLDVSVGEKIRGGIVAEDPALVHDNGSVAQVPDKKHVMGNYDFGHLQFFENFQKKLLTFRVQAGRGLIKEQDLGVHAQRCRNCQPFSLAPAHIERDAVVIASELNSVQGFFNPFLDLG